MRLKSLTLQGFKSFPERVTIQFHAGLTAVVGPNGSGKSNISDAVRWVLGEQSGKALRVKSMEDIIFGGAQFRRPQSFAFVELSMDNADRTLPFDADEVTVGRRLYRSGESEYMINQKQVRLKDIYELFLDTGLGRDGYSIIGQGRIAEIVSAKGTDRRDIFEEAAGIAKFRYRREEAEHQLTAAEENLVRIRDIERELQERVGPLREQSEKAKEFLRLSDLRKRLDVSLSVFRFRTYQDALRELEDKLCVVRGQVGELEAEDAAAEEEITSCYEKMQRLAAEIDRNRRQVHDNEAQIAGSSSEIAVFRNEISHAREALLRNAAEAGVNERQKAALGEALDKLGQERDENRRKMDALAAQIEALETQISQNSERLVQYFAVQNELSQKLQEMANAIGEENYRLAHMDAQQGETARRISDGQERMEQRGFDRTACEERVTRQTEELEKLNRQIDDAQERISQAQQQVFELQKRLENENIALREVEQKHNAVLQRVQILNDLENNMEGFYGSVRQVVLAGRTGKLPGVRGTVSNLISVDRAYTVAIEIALGSALQHIVVETEQDAKNGIEFLKRGGYGRATFLPLDTIRGEILRLPELDGMSGYLGVAAKLVRYDPSYTDVIGSVLGRILVAQTLDDASAIAARTGRRYRVVTLDGQVINTGGSYTGGSLGKSTGLLSRKNEIVALRAEKKQLEQRMAERGDACQNARNELELAQSRLKPRLSALEETRREQVRQSVELQNRKKQLEVIEADLKRLEEEQCSLQDAQKQYEQGRSELRKKVEAMEAEQLAVFDRIGQENAATAELRRENDARLQEKNTYALQRLAVEKDAERCQNDIDSTQDRLRELDGENARLAKVRADTEAAVADWEEQIRSSAARTASLAADNQKQDEQTSGLIRQREELEKTVSQKRAEQRAKTGDRERLAAEIARLSERESVTTAEQEKVVARLWEEYELSKQQAFELAEPVDNVNARTAELNRCRGQIKALGQVNVGAIDEYKQVNERYEFLQGQIADVEKSRAELMGIIAELEKNMKAMFAEAFQNIAREFTALFSQFFGGGRAMLELSDPDDLLNSGIEISVQPPGKIVKSLTALSGGEQAFIAICLYFAILRVRPSPFCLLDEVESALDDVNVSKVARYLHTIGDTQIIAITHRRGTMEQADVLYGVTTQQDGVSRVLTLDLTTAVAALDKQA